MTFSRQYLLLQHLSISWISQLLLTRSWPNFKGRFLGRSWTYFNRHNKKFAQKKKIAKNDNEQTKFAKKWFLNFFFLQKNSFALKKSSAKKNFNRKNFLRKKGVVSSYQISLVLPSVGETHPKMYQSRCNLQFSIYWYAGGKILSFENRYSLL